ncbi:phasin family protein [Methylobacterium sp. Leaf466]|uniref:phasin family protein n=1 Tax=Methylobacterium sp. Leaf466 TaxID=1736386 RepID=UPI000AE71913|nr:phasin family protein [Methylobacterium sp. Leaf466]
MMTNPLDKAAFDTLRETGHGGIGAMLKAVGTFSRTAQTMGIESVDYAKQSMIHANETMKALAKVQTPQAAMEIQTTYLKGSYERLMDQAKLMADLYQGLAKDLTKPVEGRVRGGLPAAV